MEKDIERLEQAIIYQITQNVTIKKKIDKLDFIKIIICSSKDTLKKMNRQAKDWEKVFLIHRADIHIYIF